MKIAELFVSALLLVLFVGCSFWMAPLLGLPMSSVDVRSALLGGVSLWFTLGFLSGMRPSAAAASLGRTFAVTIGAIALLVLFFLAMVHVTSALRLPDVNNAAFQRRQETATATTLLLLFVTFAGYLVLFARQRVACGTLAVRGKRLYYPGESYTWIPHLLIMPFPVNTSRWIRSVKVDVATPTGPPASCQLAAWVEIDLTTPTAHRRRMFDESSFDRQVGEWLRSTIAKGCASITFADLVRFTTLGANGMVAGLPVRWNGNYTLTGQPAS